MPPEETEGFDEATGLEEAAGFDEAAGLEEAANEVACTLEEPEAAVPLLEEVALLSVFEVVSTASKILPRWVVQVGRWLDLYHPIAVEPQASVASRPVEVQ